MDKRKTKKGKWEYLIRWKGYGSNEDTWEPEHHLLHCEEFIDQFQALRVHKDRRSRPGKHSAAAGPHIFTRAGGDSQAFRPRAEPQKKKRTGGAAGGSQKPRKVAAGGRQASDKPARSAAAYRSAHGDLPFLPFRRSHHGIQNGVLGPLRYRDPAKVHKLRRGRAEDNLEDIDVREAPIMNELGRGFF